VRAGTGEAQRAGILLVQRPTWGTGRVSCTRVWCTRVPRAKCGLRPHHVFTLTATLTAAGRPFGGQPVSFTTGHTRLCTPHTSTRGVATCVLTAAQAR
jgi:hypothetical protein